MFVHVSNHFCETKRDYNGLLLMFGIIFAESRYIFYFIKKLRFVLSVVKDLAEPILFTFTETLLVATVLVYNYFLGVYLYPHKRNRP